MSGYKDIKKGNSKLRSMLTLNELNADRIFSCSVLWDDGYRLMVTMYCSKPIRLHNAHLHIK